jgi:hypothetical protein
MEKITCPNCTHKFDIEGALAKDIDAKYKEQLIKERKELKESYEAKQKSLEEQQLAFETKKKQENEIFQQRLDKAVIAEQEKIKEKIQTNFQQQLASQQQELEEKSNKIKSLQEKELELVKMERSMIEMQKDMEIKMQRKLIDEQTKIEENVAKRINEENELRIKEMTKQMEDQHKLIQEMKRKSEQGSMQLQGEIQELAIEEVLRNNFPHDIVQEIPKGARGADTIQVVMDDHHDDCGKIIYESKRTKTFSNEWIAKLKQDQRSLQAEIAVIVTEVLPKDMDRFGIKNGVYICTFQEFKSLVFVLRQILLKSKEVRSSEVNKTDKMEMLYNFLTSEEFKLQMSGIVEGFQGMKEDIDREKRSMQSMWKRREKQLELVISNTIDMHGSIKGIAGKAIPSITQLELPE